MLRLRSLKFKFICNVVNLNLGTIVSTLCHFSTQTWEKGISMPISEKF